MVISRHIKNCVWHWFCLELFYKSILLSGTSGIGILSLVSRKKIYIFTPFAGIRHRKQCCFCRELSSFQIRRLPKHPSQLQPNLYCNVKQNESSSQTAAWTNEKILNYHKTSNFPWPFEVSKTNNTQVERVDKIQP